MNYTDEHIQFLQLHYTVLSQKELTELFNETFGCTQKKECLASACKRRGILSGRSGQFYKGMVSWNSGKKGLTSANKTSFKKGDKPKNWKPIGSERTDEDGFILIKVEEPDPHRGFKTRYRHKHVVVWELHNGKVPEGHVIRLIDGIKSHCEIENLICLKRSEHIQLNRMDYKNIPEEAKKTAITLAQLQCKVFELKKKENHEQVQ